MATRTISVAGGNWSSAGTWDEGIAPTNADDVVARAGGDSGNLTNDVTNQACRSLDFTNYSGLWTYTSLIVKIGGSALPASNVALKCSSTMTISQSGGTIQFVATTTGGTITTNAKSLNNVTFNGVAGGWTLQDTLTTTSNAALTLTAGTLNTNSQSLSLGLMSITGATARTLTMDNSSVVLNNNGGTPWNATTTTLLGFTATGSTIEARNGTATATFAGGGLTYATVSRINTGAGGLTITGANTFGSLIVTGAARTLTLPASTTQVISTLTLQGTGPSALLTIVSSSSGTAATVSVASGTVVAANVSLKDSTASGGAAFVAEGTNVSGNTGWHFVGFWPASLNDIMMSSLQLTYNSPGAALNDLVARFKTDNSLSDGNTGWLSVFGGSGSFNDRAYTYWLTHP